MTVFMVERDLKGVSLEALGQAQAAAIEKARELTEAGVRVRYLRSTFAPEDGRCMCLVEATDEAAVRRMNDEAGLPYHRIVEALDLAAPQAGR